MTERAELVALADNLSRSRNGFFTVVPHEDCQKIASALRRLAAQDQKPVAWRYELAHSRVWEGGKPTRWTDWRWHVTEFEPYVPEGSIRNLTPLYLSPPPAAGWDETKLQSIIERALLEDDDFCTRAAYQNIRQTIARASAKTIVEALRRNAPSDSGAGKSAPLLRTSHNSGERDPVAMPDHGGADAGVKIIRNLQSYLRVLRSSRERKIALEVWKSDIDLIERAVSALSQQPAPLVANASAEQTLNWKISDAA